MTFNGRLFILIIIALALIPGSYGKSLTTGGGTSVDVSDGCSAEGVFATDGVDTRSIISTSGVIDNLDLEHWVTNELGDSATVGMDAKNTVGLSYDSGIYPGEGDEWDSNCVWTWEKISVDTADYLNAYSTASNSAGDSASANMELYQGSLQGYYNAAYAGPALWLGLERGAFVQQTADYADGAYIHIQTETGNAARDEAIAVTNVANGVVNGYSAQANAVKYVNGDDAAGVLADSVDISVSNGALYHCMATSDNNGDTSSVIVNLDNGELNSYSLAYSIGDKGLAHASLSMNAEGSLIDVLANAENQKEGNEYLSYSDGTTKYITSPTGIAAFEFQTSDSLTANVDSKATAENVLISPSLPTGTQTALMLEPMNYAFTSIGGATDLGTTVFPTLVKKRYAVLRYTDSGASLDKFQNLGDYNIALVDSHMNSNGIGLSTGSGYVSASQLDYQTSKNSLVILAGCDSFDGYPKKSALAASVSEADLNGGYANTVGTLWNNDYLSYFFDALCDGKTASSANDYAYTLATDKYGGSSINLPLVFYGDQTFKL